ncbi:hypothetical protein [Paucibacter soli]|uniref:hypothetical protein n=1 Tax=Paucibacter soli TaxID=3133433 RepID=UPI003099A6B0
MSTHTTLLRLGGITLLALAAAACNSAPKVEARDSATLLKDIKAEIGDAACDAPQQCRSIAVGHKSCGGPEGYLAWSSKRSDAAKLQTLVEQHAAARRAENLRSGMMSDCRLVTDPGSSCQAGRCSLLAGGGAGATGQQ